MIYVIAGHHDNDPGASGNGLREADLTKELRGLITERIIALRPDIEVRNDNDGDTLRQVIAKIRPKIKSTDILLDIHFDSFTNPKSTGSTAIISKNAGVKSKELAKDLVAITSTIVGINNRGVKDETTTSVGGLGILNMRGAAVLLEVGFISNPGDMENYLKNNGAIKYWLGDEIARILINHHG